MKALRRLVILLAALVSMTICLRGGKTQVPPGKEVRKEGFYIVNRGTIRSLDLDENDMMALVYDLDEIPGFASQGTIIELNVGGDRERGGLESRLIRVWRGREHKVSLHIECIVCQAKESAQAWLEAILKYSSAAPMFKQGSFSGLPLGDKCWRNPSANTLFFTVGRVFVIVQVLGPKEMNGLFAEALSVGIEYSIRLHPKKLAEVPKPLSVLVSNQPVARGKAVALVGVVVAPISALEPAQVSIRTNRTKKEWTVTASRNGRWVRLEAFSWEMETDKGKVKLERPVFPYKGELIVPLRQVAEALGIVFHQRGQTIALMAK